MQTFLPYKDFKQSAACLDRSRLGKQRVENLQIMKALVLPEYGWKNHPAVKMWEGAEVSLFAYHIAICDEWTSRGYQDTCKDKFTDLFINNGPYGMPAPFWCDDERVFSSHRSNLLRKDPEWYGQFGWTESDDIEYFWPTKEKS